MYCPKCGALNGSGARFCGKCGGPLEAEPVVYEAPEESVVSGTSGGSKANIEDIAAEANQLGFVQSDVMSYAYSGKSLFEEPVEGFSTVAAMYMEQVQIITLNPDIKTVADLEGKIVSIGALGSGVYFNAIDLLGAYGLTEADIEPVYQSFGDSVESLQDGKIDAAFIVSGAPTNAVTSLATTNDVYLVSLDAAHIAALIEASPYYAEATIAAAEEDEEQEEEDEYEEEEEEKIPEEPEDGEKD